MVPPTAADIRELVDERCDQFEAAWVSGERPQIRGLLAAVPGYAREELCGELIALQMELRVRAGEFPAVEGYLDQFPQYAETIHSRFAEFQCWARSTAAIDESLRSRVLATEHDTERQSLETKEWPGGGDMPVVPAEQVLPSLNGEGGHVIGRYRVVRKLGQGGMGSVLLARDPLLDRLVALKLPHFQADDGPATIERFYREARSMAAVHHPHLCPIYDVGEADGHPYLAMGYVDGQSLAEKIESRAAIDAGRAARLVRTLALAVQAIHEAGVVHRDLKPSNVMIDGRGQPLVTDFGLATGARPNEAELTRSGAIIGSPAYMAPEQVRGQVDRIGPHTDVYSLGVILYQLLCGRRPFDGTAASVLGQIESGARPPRPSRLAQVDRRLESICLRAMAHKASDRYQTAADLAAALEPFARGQKAATGERVEPLRLRHGRWVAGLVLAAVAGGIVAWLWAAGLLFRVETPGGDLVIHVADERFATSVVERKVTFTNTETNDTYTIHLRGADSVKRLEPGEYRFVLETKTGLRTTTDRFTISAGGKTQVEAWWEPRVAATDRDKVSNDRRGVTKKSVRPPPPVSPREQAAPRILPRPPAGDGAAATIEVSTTADVVDGDVTSVAKLVGRPGADGAISLREAIIAANATAGDDTIDVNVDGAITLSIAGTDEDESATGDLDITSNITIQGAGARTTIVDGGGLDRVFEIPTSGVRVQFNDLTIRNGKAVFGGGCHFEGAEHLIEFNRVRVTGNRTLENGGGLSIAGDDETMIVNIRDSLIDNNSSEGINAGGCAGIVVYPGGTVSIVNTTISGNTGLGAGALTAQFNGSGAVEIVNSTITANESTFPKTGGVQKNDHVRGMITLTNSIVAGNSGDQFLGEAGGRIKSGGHNIIGPGHADFDVDGSDRLFSGPIDKLLSPLADNGGPTDSHALVAGSPAIDAGANQAADDARLTTDQRGEGFDRVINGTADIGAFEFAARPD